MNASADGPNIPTTSRAQIDALNAMFGGDHAPTTDQLSVGPIVSVGEFTAVGGTWKKTRCGIAWRPERWPESVVMEPSTTELIACVDYWQLCSRGARTPRTRQELEERVARYLPLRGIQRFRLSTPPERWTLDTLVSVLLAVKATLLSDTQPANVRCDEPGPWQREVDERAECIRIGTYGKLGMSITLYLAAGAGQSARAFRKRFGDRNGWAFMHLQTLAEHANAGWPSADPRSSASDASPATEEPDDQDEYDDDNDDDDDDEQDLDSRLILAAVRQSMWPSATWDDVKHTVRFLRLIVEAKKRNETETH